MSRRQALRSGPSPDVPPRPPASLPRCLPFLLVPAGVMGRRHPVLVTPFARRARGLADAERSVVEAMQARMARDLAADHLPSGLLWIDAENGAISQLDGVDPAWLKRKLNDQVAVEVRAGR